MTVEEIKNYLFKDKEIKDFCLKYNLDDKTILKSIGKFSNYIESKNVCHGCNGQKCGSSVPEMKVNLLYEENDVRISYSDCLKAKANKPGNLEVIGYNVNGEDIKPSINRINLFRFFDKFSEDYFKKIPTKGIYLWGKCGVGKSFLLYKFACKLSEKGAKVIFAYYPDLVRQIQNNIGNGPQMESLIKRLKCIDILMLDDIAREANTPYIRDLILGPILQYRVDNSLPMFMTSNRDFKLLEEHLSNTNNFIDSVKGKAIMERIKFLMREYELDDINYRE